MYLARRNLLQDKTRSKYIADRVLWLEDGEFKQAITMTIDPVCGMSIETDQAITAPWQGQVFHFCAQGCRDEFLASPEKYVDVEKSIVGRNVARLAVSYER